MAETQGTRSEQDAPTASGGDATPDTDRDPLAQGRGRTDEVDQSRGIFPPGVPHPKDAEVRPPGALGGGPYEESGRGGVGASEGTSSAGAGAAGSSVAGADVASADPADASARGDDEAAADVLMMADETDVLIVDADADDADVLRVVGAADAASGVVIVDTGEADADMAAADAAAAAAEVNEGGVTAARPVDEETVSALNDLIHLDIDAIQAYARALEACEIEEIRDNLTAFMADHERHVRDLRDAVRGLGGEPVAGRDVKGVFIEGFTAIVSQGDRSALVAMRGNEELTNRRYKAARKAGLNEAVRPLVEGNYQDEARHLAWIKQTISSRAWDAEPGANKAA